MHTGDHVRVCAHHGRQTGTGTQRLAAALHMSSGKSVMILGLRDAGLNRQFARSRNWRGKHQAHALPKDLLLIASS